jgi:flagellar hook assembly protein FlgD
VPDVEVAVHDLSGRRVATLFRGALAAGPHDFAWRGERSDGSAAANGIYFVQARVGGERLSGKVIFLRGN